VRAIALSALLLVLLIAISVVLASIASTHALARARVVPMDADTTSAIDADYSASPEDTRLAPLDEGIIESARRDEDSPQRASADIEIVPVHFGDRSGDGTADTGSGSTDDASGGSPAPSPTPTHPATSTPRPEPTPKPTPNPTSVPTPAITPAPTTISLVSTADAFATQNTPNKNQGSNTNMRVDGETGKLERSFVKFDLSSIRGQTTVDSAMLTLCFSSIPQADAQGRSHEVRRMTSPWTETGLTWATQPTVSTTVTGVLTVPSGIDCLTVDVTTDVRAWVSGATNYGWRIAYWSEAELRPQVAYATRENPDSNLWPTLKITYRP
jgi:hypothetical protein